MSVKIANVLKMIVKSLSDFFGRQIRLPAFFASELVQLTLIARNTRGIGLHMVKSHAVNFFYRSYQGFNTLTLSI